MRFVDQSTSREGRFSIGTDMTTAEPYLSIPVRNSMVDYEEYYRLTPDEYARLNAQVAVAAAFAQECRLRLHDDRLILQPGRERGEPW